MNSHEYANKLRTLAETILSLPEFETPKHEHANQWMFYYGDKDGFLSAVRALGSGKKVYKDVDLQFLPDCSELLKLEVSRSAVCRKVQEEKWECEPLLSQAEEAEIGVGSDKWKAHDIQETECGL